MTYTTTLEFCARPAIAVAGLFRTPSAAPRRLARPRSPSDALAPLPRVSAAVSGAKFQESGVGTLSSPAKRIRGRRGVELRKRRLTHEPLCRMCKAGGTVRAATVPDHIVPLAKGGEDVDENIRCLCAEHHDQVTRQEFGQCERVSIGPDGWPIGTP
jgi:5-methylcytosine-specific restriction enzyme A